MEECLCKYHCAHSLLNPLTCTSHYSGFYVITVQTFARYLLYSISFAFCIRAIGISDTSFVQLQRRTFNTNGVTGRRKFSYTELYKTNTEKRRKTLSCSMIKMADNIQAMLRFCVEEAEAGLCAQENGLLRIAIQAAVHHSSSDAIFAAYSALALVFAARWKMPLLETRRWWCV